MLFSDFQSYWHDRYGYLYGRTHANQYIEMRFSSDGYPRPLSAMRVIELCLTRTSAPKVLPGYYVWGWGRLRMVSRVTLFSGHPWYLVDDYGWIHGSQLISVCDD